MKRCPTCSRVETDDALVFCRIDGTALISDSSLFISEVGTQRAGSVATEIETSIFPHSTDASIQRPTDQTSGFSSHPAFNSTRKLSTPKRRKALVLAIVPLILAASAASVYFYLSRKNNTAIDSIAVLPFVNQSSDPDTEYLSDGLSESLIYRLSQLPSLKVSPTSSVFRYKGKEVDPLKVGNELSVSAVLSGRIAQHGENLTISVEFVDVRNNKILWGERYDRKISELLATQREIANEIAENLKLRISAQERGLTKHYTESPEAYQLYLKGRFYWNQRNGESLKKSIDYFNQAIEKDPGFALAYTGLADTYLVLPYYSVDTPRESIAKAKAAAKKALEIDESLAEAHSVLAYGLTVYDWNFAESQKEFQRAIELNPGYSTAHQWYGDRNLVCLGRMDEAIAELKRAQELDPVSLIINADLGDTYTEAHQ